MSQDPRDLLQRYLPRRRFFEAAFWIVLFSGLAFVNTLVAELDVDRVKLRVAPWEPAAWEWSSHLVMLALIPAIVAFERRFPLQLGLMRKHLPWHLLASVVVSAAHVVGMVGVRKAIYAMHGATYRFGDWPRELFYEYLKDGRSYFTILLVVVVYRLVLMRLQGEVKLLDAPDAGPSEGSIERPERFLVKKLGKEFLLPAAEIESVQAMGNYVNLRVRGREYPLRGTMQAIESRLDPAKFTRVHRSYIVNLDEISEIEPTDGGDARIKMRDGSYVPCSRRYRDGLRRVAA